MYEDARVWCQAFPADTLARFFIQIINYLHRWHELPSLVFLFYLKFMQITCDHYCCLHVKAFYTGPARNDY